MTHLNSLLGNLRGLTEARKKKPRFYPQLVLDEISRAAKSAGAKQYDKWKPASFIAWGGPADTWWGDFSVEGDSDKVAELGHAVGKVLMKHGIPDNGYHYGKGFNFGLWEFKWEARWGKKRYGAWMSCHENGYGPGKHKCQIQVYGDLPPKGRR